MTDRALGAYQRHEHTDRNADGDRYCPAERDYFACSREDGHTGPHVAATRDVQNSICEVWDQAEARAEQPQMKGDGGRYNFLVMSDGNAYQHVDDIKPRPFTSEDITDEMVERAGRTYVRAVADRGYVVSMKDVHTREAFSEALTAALTPASARPEGAEALETVIGLNAGNWTEGADDVRALADLLASNGVRVQGDAT